MTHKNKNAGKKKNGAGKKKKIKAEFYQEKWTFFKMEKRLNGSNL